MGAVAVAAVGLAIITGGLVTLVRGRTPAPGVTWTVNANTPARARAVGVLWVAIGVAFIVFALRM
jgi:hypothetical protein